MLDATPSSIGLLFYGSIVSLLVGAVLIALGACGLVKAGAAKEKLAVERMRYHESETLEAKAAASKAGETAEAARQANLALQADLDRERAARIKLQNQLVPRRLSSDQAQALVEAIKPFAGQKIEIMVPTGDSEASAYAADFETAFKNAGWDTMSGIAQERTAVPLKGVTLTISEADRDVPPPRAIRLAETLVSLGLSQGGATNPQVAPGSVRLLVGSKS